MICVSLPCASEAPAIASNRSKRVVVTAEVGEITMTTRSRDNCRARYHPQSWSWTVLRVISLSFLTFLKVSANDGKTTCSMPSVEPLQDTVLTCHFPEDLGIAKKDFTIYHYVKKDNPDAVVDCWWLGGSIDCFSKSGFKFDKSVGTHLSATVTEVNNTHEGYYACQVAGYGPTSLGTCEFKLKFGTDNTCKLVPVSPNQADLTCHFNEDVSKTQRNITVYRHTGPDEPNPVLSCWWDGQEPKCWVESGYQLFSKISSYLVLRLPNGDSNYSCGHTNSGSNSQNQKMCQMVKDKGSGSGQTEETTQTVIIIVGIVVTVVVLTLLGISLVIFLNWRRNRRPRSDVEQQPMLGWSKSNRSKGNKNKVKLTKEGRQLMTQQFNDYLLQSVSAMFPDTMDGCFFVPPVYFNTTTYTTTRVADQVVNIPECPEASVVTHDKGVQRVLYCLRHWAEHRRRNMFLVTQLEYQDYLNGDQTFTGHTLPKATHLVNKNKAIKCFDLMIIHRQHGIVLGVVVDVDVADDSRGEEEEDKTILSHFSDAIQQLKKAEGVVSHVMSDLSQCLPIRKTFIFPHLSVSSLQRALEADVGLAQELRAILNIKIVEKSASGVSMDSLEKISADRHETLKHHFTSNLKNDNANKNPDDTATTVTADLTPKHDKGALKIQSEKSKDTACSNSNSSFSDNTTANRNNEKAAETSESGSPQESQCPTTETANNSCTDTTDDHAGIVDNHKSDTKNSEGYIAEKIEEDTMGIPIKATSKVYDASTHSSSKSSIVETSDGSNAETSNDPMGKAPDDPMSKTLDNPTDTILDDPIRVCLCADHLSDPQKPSEIPSSVLEDLELWWSLLTSSSDEDIGMNDDLYLKLISRVCGPATTPTFLMPGDREPVLLPKTLDQAVSLTGELFERLTLYSDMTDLLKEPRLILCGPPATGKTTMLMLAGRSWLLQGHDVYVLKTSESFTESRVEQSLKLENFSQQEGGDAGGKVFVYCANIKHEKSRKTAFKEILKHSGQKPVHIIADELECDTEEVKQVIETSLKINNNQNFIWITSSRGSKVPTGWRQELLTTALRCPPAVVREAATILTQHFPDVRPYSPSNFPAPTDGPPVKYIYHGGQGHAKGQPRDCDQCANEVANFLTRIIRTSQGDLKGGTRDVTQRVSQGVRRHIFLHARDVMILFESEVDHTKTTMLRKLIEAGIFVDVTVTPSAGDSDIRLAREATLLFGEKGKVVEKHAIKAGVFFHVTVTPPEISAGDSDVALAGEASRLRGEKRKVVVYVEDNVDNSDIWWTRLRGITSCYSQLIRVINGNTVHKA